MKNKRLNPVAPESAQGEIKKIYETIHQKFNTVPNIFKNMGNSAAVLKGYFALSDAANQTSFSPKLREEIALAVGQANQCDYCLSAHTTIGHTIGLQDAEMIQARKGTSSNEKDAAILSFTKKIVDSKGAVSDEDVNELKAAGVTDKELVELILVVTVNMFTNYFNHITGTEIDFPQAPNLN